MSVDGRFVWAAPVDYQESEVDKIMKAKANKVLQAYLVKRKHYIETIGLGASVLLQDWFCKSPNDCDPTYASSK